MKEDLGAPPEALFSYRDSSQRKTLAIMILQAQQLARLEFLRKAREVERYVREAK